MRDDLCRAICGVDQHAPLPDITVCVAVLAVNPMLIARSPLPVKRGAN